jgi:hypothetical protein
MTRASGELLERIAREREQAGGSHAQGDVLRDG